MSAGVPDRQWAILLARLYSSQVKETSPGGFRRWLGNLDPEELAEDHGVPEASLTTLSRAIFRRTQNPALARLDEGQPLLPLVVTIRVSRSGAAVIGALRPGETLIVARDYESPYRNATYVQSEGHMLGYLRLGDALLVAPELDAGLAVEANFLSVEAADADRPRLNLELREAAGRADS
jgi:hypothetical protein